MHIIIRGKSGRFGKTRSEIEKNLAKEGWGTSLTQEQIEKCTYLEKKAKEKYGLEKSHMRTLNIDKVGKKPISWLDKK